MKTVRKKVRSAIALFLAVIMLMPLWLLNDMKIIRDLHDVANADEVTGGSCGVDGDNVTWEYADGVLTISGSGAMEDYNGYDHHNPPWYYFEIESVVIESGVTSIGDYAFSRCSSLREINIPVGVVKIGNFAFEYCRSLESINIPVEVSEIGFAAFDGCSRLESIDIPAKVTYIGNDAFWSCDSLKEILVDTNNTAYASEEGVLFNKTKTQLICCPRGKEGNYDIPIGVVYIDSMAFDGCSRLESINIPEGVTEIGMYVFEGCDSLREILVDTNNTAYVSEEGVLFNKTKTQLICCPGGKEGNYDIPVGVMNIDSRAFYGSSLESINIPERVTKIGYGVFQGCSSLKSINIPKGVTEIGDSAFEGCSSLESINIPEGVTEIGEDVFRGCSSLKLINIPEGVTEIGRSVFSYCSSLESINIPEGVTGIGGWAFSYCSNLKSINIPEGVTEIGYGVFNGCSSLKSINIPEAVMEIGWCAFCNCSSLKSINIPEAVMNIGSEAFEGCSSLTDVYYFGKEEQWNGIEIYSDNKCLTDAVLHCIDTSLSVDADVSTAVPGSEITFNVYVNSPAPFTGIMFDLDIPSGLTYVEGSGKVVEGAKEELRFDETEFMELAKRGTFSNSTPYTKLSKLALVEFKCSVDIDCEVGEYTVYVRNGEITKTDFDIVSIKAAGKKINVATIPLTDISLNVTTASVNEGDNVTLTPIFMPDKATNKNIIWTSSDESIATVDNNGNVTGLKKGTVIITATSEDGGYTASCAVTVKCAHVNTTSHADVESTCTIQGNGEYMSCDDCGEIISGSDEKLPFKAHVLTKHDRVEPDHFTAGSIEYYVCDECEKLFGDTEGKNEIFETDIDIPPITHTYSDTWSYDETNHWYECSCGDKTQVISHEYTSTCDDTCNECGYVRTITHDYATGWVYDAAGHWRECTVCDDKTVAEGHTGGKATCIDNAVCEICSVAYGELIGHVNVEKADAQYLKSAADCSHEAVYYKSCDVCGEASSETFEYGKSDFNNHVGATEIRDAVPAGCTVSGYSGDVYCKSCGKLVSSGEVIPSKGGHEASEWKKTGNEHYKECVVCGEEIEGSRTSHILGGWIIDIEATFTKTGSKHKECTVCKKITIMEKIALLIEYKITVGANGIWSGEDFKEGSISFRADAEFGKFEGVRIDGRLIAGSNYEAREGSTIVTLKEEYLNTLSPGIHDITIVSSDGEANTTFEIKKQAEPVNPSITTDKPEKPSNPSVTTDKTEEPSNSGVTTDKIEKPSTPPTGDGNNIVPLIATILIIVGVFAAFIIIGEMNFSKNKKAE